MSELRHLHTDQHFSRWNDITAERNRLIRREIDDGNRVVWLHNSRDGIFELPKSRAAFLENTYADESGEDPLPVKNDPKE